MRDEPAAGRPLLSQASALLDLGRREDAVRLLHAELGREPQSVPAQCLLARAYLELNRPKDALVAARQALLLQPEDEWPHRLLSISLLRVGKKKEALGEALACAQLAPSLPQTLTTLIQAQLAVKDQAGAEVTGARLLALAPDAAGTHVHVGNIAFAQKNWQTAAECYRRALGIDPRNNDAMRNLGIALARQHKSIDAFDHLYNAVRLNPQDERAQRSLYGAIEGYLMPIRTSLPRGIFMALAIIPQVRAIWLLLVALDSTVVRWWRVRTLTPELRRFYTIYRKSHHTRRRRVVRTVIIVLAILVIVALVLALIASM